MDAAYECVLCGGTDYHNLDGFYYCTECGTQSQTQQDVIQDEDNVEFTYSAMIKTKRGTKRKAVEEEDEPWDASLHESWQLIFVMLIKSLLKCGFDPSVKESAKILWCLYLDHVFQLQLRYYQKVDTMDRLCFAGASTTSVIKMWQDAKRLKLDEGLHYGSQDYYESLPDEDDIEAIDFSSMDRCNVIKACNVLYKRRNLRRGHGFVTRNDLVILLYLSLLHSGHIILLSDLLKMMHDDKIPLYSWVVRVPSAMSKRLWKVHTNRLGKNMIIKTSDIAEGLAVFIKELRLNHMPIDLMAIGNLLLEKLLLPDCLSIYLKRLLYLYHDGSLYYVTQHDKNLLPSLCAEFNVMCLVVVLMKLLYRLDDHFEIEQSALADTVDQAAIDKSNSICRWTDWIGLVAKERYTNVQNSTSLTTREVLLIEDHREYFSYVRKYCFNTFCAKDHFKKPNSHIGTLWSEKLSPIFSSYLKKKRKRWGVKSNIDELLTSQKENAKTCSRPLYVMAGDKIRIVEPSSVHMIPLDMEVPGLGRAWEQYCPISGTTVVTKLNYSELMLPTSQDFLLKHAAYVIDVPLEKLVTKVRSVEKFLISHVKLVIATMEAVQ